jgi:hypothetical protein
MNNRTIDRFDDRPPVEPLANFDEVFASSARQIEPSFVTTPSSIAIVHVAPAVRTRRHASSATSSPPHATRVSINRSLFTRVKTPRWWWRPHGATSSATRRRRRVFRIFVPGLAHVRIGFDKEKGQKPYVSGFLAFFRPSRIGQLVEAAGVEPASVGTRPSDLHA